LDLYIEKKEYIVKSAQKLFSRFGFLKTTVDEIAKSARMGKASIYHYFKSKIDIFREVVEMEEKVLEREVKKATEKVKTPQQKMKAFVMTKMKYLQELTNIHSVLKEDDLDHYSSIRRIREKDFLGEIELVKSILEDGVKKNIFVIRDTNLAAFAFISALKGLEYPWTIKIPSLEIEKNVDTILEILFNGIVKR